MNQCPRCGSFNDPQAAFCNQCGGRLQASGRTSPGLAPPRKGRSSPEGRRRGHSAGITGARKGSRRGLIGSLLVSVLLVLLVGVILALREDREPEPKVVEPVPANVTPEPEPDPRVEMVATPEPEPAPEPPRTEAPPDEREPESAVRTRVSTLVARALVILELRDAQERTTEQRGVLIDESGVVLCRFRPLIGARSGTARLLTAESVRTEIRGLSFRDEASDLALLRLAPLAEAFPAAPLASAADAAALRSGDTLYVFNDYRAIPAAIDSTDYLASDGIRRILLGKSEHFGPLPPESFLVADASARVIGLCRAGFSSSGETGEPPENGQEVEVPEEDEFLVDAAAPLTESIGLQVGLTLEELTDRLYVGTFPDLYQRGRRAFREQQWNRAIELFEAALERVPRDEPPEEQIAEVDESLRESYLREADRLFKARRYRETVSVAASAVARYQDQPVLWRLLGEARLALDEDSDGIAALLEARALEPNQSVEKSLESAYLKVASGHAQRGDDRLAELSLLEGIEAVPSSAELYIELAKLYMRFEAYDDAVRLLDQARTLDARQGDRIDGLLEKIDDALARRDAVIIPMTSSNSIRASVVIDGRVEETFIIDTGATYTAVTEKVAEALGHDVQHAPRIPVRTANGVVETPLVRMESISLEGYTVRNLDVLVLPEKYAGGVRLLGLNFLNHFKYTVDAQRREFRLERP